MPCRRGTDYSCQDIGDISGQTPVAGWSSIRFFVILFEVPAAGSTCIIVHYHLILLPVALTWCKNHCSGVFEHRNKIRYYDRLSIQIFGSTEQAWTLPAPFVTVVLIKFSVTLPYGNMPVL